MRPRAERRALLVFIAVQVLAGGLWLVLGRRQWFIADEWDFLADRDGGDLGDLLRPHNEHWSTVPILVYRALWNVAGLRSYVPYLLPVIAAHLTAAALLRVVMRRSGVDPWIATAAASAFALFGAGYFNILYPFQIGLTGALAVGLAALLIADRDGGLQRIDLVGVLTCIASLLFAGVAVVMVGSVGLAVLLRRGPKVAAVYVAPSAAVYLTWATTAGAGAFERSGTLGQVARFVDLNVRSTFEALGQSAVLGIVLAAVMVVGLTLVWRDGKGPLARLAAPISLLVGAFAFALTTGIGRGAGYAQPGTGADASRYLHLTAALLLPGLALAANAIAARWRITLVPLALLFIIPVPINVWDARRVIEDHESEVHAFRDRILVTARLPVTEHLPASTQADPSHPWVTIGWLRDGVESGRIPEPVDEPDVDLTGLVADLVLNDTEDDEPAVGCEPLGQDLVPLDAGQRLVARGPVGLRVAASPSAPAGAIERYFLPGYAKHVLVDGYSVGVMSGEVLVCEVADDG